MPNIAFSPHIFPLFSLISVERGAADSEILTLRKGSKEHGQREIKRRKRSEQKITNERESMQN